MAHCSHVASNSVLSIICVFVLFYNIFYHVRKFKGAILNVFKCFVSEPLTSLLVFQGKPAGHEGTVP